MRIIKPYYVIESPIVKDNIYKHIEKCGHTCYKSEDKITDDSADKFIRGIIKSGHLSVIEHHSISVRFICDRALSHELVRSRIASFSQESQRYVNYSKDKFGGQVSFIEPFFFDRSSPKYKLWHDACINAEFNYFELLREGATPQEARAVLPNSTKTEIVVTANLREWRLILQQRTSQAAHPQMRELMCPLLEEFKQLLPAIFDDLDE